MVELRFDSGLDKTDNLEEETFANLNILNKYLINSRFTKKQ